MSRENLVDEWAERISAAYLADDLGLAASQIEQAVDETSSAPQILELAGMVAFREGDFSRAARLIESAMFEITVSIGSQLTLARAWLKTGDKIAAEQTLSFLVEIVNRVPCSMLPDLTHSVAELQRFDLAIAVCREAFLRHPDDDNAAFGVAFYMHRAGYPTELVRNAMQKAVDLNPESQLYRLNLAMVCCSLQLWREAYGHACRLSDKSIQSIPCTCMSQQMKDLFVRCRDLRRLKLMGADS